MFQLAGFYFKPYILNQGQKPWTQCNPKPQNRSLESGLGLYPEAPK